VADKEKVTITKDDVHTVNAEDLIDLSKTPLLDAFRSKLKEDEARLEEIVLGAKERLEAITQSDECNKLREIIRENQPKLAQTKNELARIMLTQPGVKVLTTESGKYDNTMSQAKK
jgi:hypothetical protein